MSGGIAFVLDEQGTFASLCNRNMVDLEPVIEARDIETLRILIERHYYFTGSAPGQTVLQNWEAMLPQFVKVMPTDYKRVLGERKRHDEEMEQTLRDDETGTFVAHGR